MKLLRCCGIYEIRNTLTGHRYIGSSVRLGRRMNDHKYQLRRGAHHCHRLQRAWSRDGEGAFQMRILAVLEPAEQLPTEQRFLDALRADGEDLYNASISATAPNLGRSASAETRARLSDAMRRRFADPAERDKVAIALRNQLADPAIRAAMSAARSEDGRRHDVAAKKSAAMRAYYADPKNREKTGASARGRVVTQATREKLSAAIKKVAGTAEARAQRSAIMRARWADPEERNRIIASKGNGRRAEP